MKNFLNICKHLSSGFSLFRCLTVAKLVNLKLENNLVCADLGGLPLNKNNLVNFLKVQKIHHFNLNIQNEEQKKNTTIVDFENIDFDGYSEFKNSFDLVCAFNLLEHIKNYKNPIRFAQFNIKKNGFFIGSTPFLFRKHGSPNDYFRYTDDLLKLELKEAGFKDIRVETIGYGIFTMFFNIIAGHNRFIPFLNSILFSIALVLDSFFSIFAKNLKEIYPIGYFFIAKSE